MKKGQIIEGIVERMDFPNRGIVVCEEGVCTVKNALPGQKVRAAVNKARNGRYEGRLLEVLGAWRMPWLMEAMKDVISCDKPRLGANDL